MCDLTVVYGSGDGAVVALDGVDFALAVGETLGLVGESGSGKSTLAYALIGLLPDSAKVNYSSLVLAGEDLSELSRSEWSRVRGAKIAMVPQDPMTALNPVMKIGDQLAEVMRAHTDLTRSAISRRVVELLGLVGLADPGSQAEAFPHQLSGGMRQRVMMAMAVSCEPIVLVADEPTTALDVTVQAQLLELLTDLRDRFAMSVLLVSHDLGVVAERADRVAVMYAGRIVEVGPVGAVLTSPAHPYSQGLVRSIPRLHSKTARLAAVSGSSAVRIPKMVGCSFAPRCPDMFGRCTSDDPILNAVAPGHSAACFLVG